MTHCAGRQYPNVTYRHPATAGFCFQSSSPITARIDPDRRHHTERYHGHELSVDAQREGARWTWWYTVDGGNAGHCAPHAKLADPDAAIRRAIQAARARADELKPQRTARR